METDMFKSMILLLLASGTLPTVAGEYHQHGIHAHGVGSLNMAREGAEIHIELDSPAANLVGFEHTPRTRTEHELLKTALNRLKDGARLFLFPGNADCQFMGSEVDTPLMNHGSGRHHTHQEHHSHQDSHEHAADSHADITATYRFTCSHPERLDRVTVKLFEAFPMTERLRVQFITEQRQGAAELNASQPVLYF